MSSTSSSTPVTVMVWGVFQLAEVKVRLAAETVPSVVSEEEMPMVTSAVRSEERRVGKEGGARGSEVVRPEGGLRVLAEVSQAVLVTLTSEASMPSDVASAL